MTYAAWKAEGSFHFFPELQKYPFDTQKIEIHFEHPSLETSTLVYADDAESYKRSGQPQHLWGLGKHVTIPEYDITGVERSVRLSMIAAVGSFLATRRQAQHRPQTLRQRFKAPGRKRCACW